jgi:putative membrane protein
MLTANVVPGVLVSGWWGAFVVAVVLGILNTLVKPVLLVLTLPINIMTLGLFTLVVNTFLIMVAGGLVNGFEVTSFGAAFWFGLILSVVNWFLSKLDPGK